MADFSEGDVGRLAAELSHEFFTDETGEVSDRQWRDVCGLLKLQSGRLDESYIEKWASMLGVADLLHRARRDVEG